jgi:hypothetical protein
MTHNDLKLNIVLSAKTYICQYGIGIIGFDFKL